MFPHLQKVKSEVRRISEEFGTETTAGKVGFALLCIVVVALMASCYVLPLHYFGRYALSHGHDTYSAGLLGAVACYYTGNTLAWLLVKACEGLQKLADKLSAE